MDERGWNGSVEKRKVIDYDRGQAQIARATNSEFKEGKKKQITNRHVTVTDPTGFRRVRRDETMTNSESRTRNEI